MKTFLAVFTGSAETMSKWQDLPEDERKRRETEGIAAWKKWVRDHADILGEPGGPLSKTTLVSAAGITEIRNNLSAVSVIRAESREEAAKLFLDHPHFTIFPGDGVEVMEILPVPSG
jgi:hypothetical protein